MSDRPALPSAAVTGIALRFVAELQAGRRPSIEAALDQAPTLEWAGLLQSLLIAETNARRTRGETPLAREYLPRFPAHTDVVRTVVPEVTPVAAEPVSVTPPPHPGRLFEPPPLPSRTVLPAEVRAARAATRPGVPPAPPAESADPAALQSPGLVRPRRRGGRRFALVLLALVIATGTVLVVLGARTKPGAPPPGPPAPPGPPPRTAPQVAPKAAPTDPERDLTEWVLSLGGRGTVLPDGGSRRPFGAESPIPKVRFAVTAIILPAEAAGRWKPEDLTRLRGRDRLSSVELHSTAPLTEADLAPLTSLPLRTLEIDANPVRASGAFFAAFAELGALALPHCPDWTDADVAAIGKLPKLSALTLNSPHFTANGFKELRCPVHTLVLGDRVTLTPDHVRVLQRLPLETFESAAGMSDDAFVEFALFPNLKRIRLRGTTLTDAGLKAVVGLGKLEEFRCEGSAVTGPGLEQLAERKGLTVLDLSDGKVTNDSLGWLLSLPALRELRLAGNPIGDDGVGLLAQLDGLEVLDLAGTGVTDRSLRTLTKHPALKTLIVTGTRVTAPAVRAFEARTPGCHVEFGRRR